MPADTEPYYKMNPIEQITAIEIILHNSDDDDKEGAYCSISLNNLDIINGGCVH